MVYAQLSLNMNSSAVASVSANLITVIVIEKGPDAGKVIRLAEANISGGATLDVSGGVSITKYSYVGDIKDLMTETFEGKSSTQTTSMGLGAYIGFGTSVFKDKQGGILKGRTTTIGIGAGSPFNISFGNTISKPYKR